MIPPPGFQCREQTSGAAILAAIQGVGDCAPDGSGVANTTVNSCSTIYSLWLAFIAQIKLAFCYIFGELTSLQDQIDALPVMRTPGTVTFTPNASLGTAPTVSIVGTDTAWKLTITTDADASGTTFGVVNFLTPYTSFPYPIVTDVSAISSSLYGNILTNGAGLTLTTGGGIFGVSTYIIQGGSIGGL